MKVFLAATASPFPTDRGGDDQSPLNPVLQATPLSGQVKEALLPGPANESFASVGASSLNPVDRMSPTEAPKAARSTASKEPDALEPWEVEARNWGENFAKVLAEQRACEARELQSLTTLQTPDEQRRERLGITPSEERIVIEGVMATETSFFKRFRFRGPQAEEREVERVARKFRESITFDEGLAIFKALAIQGGAPSHVQVAEAILDKRHAEEQAKGLMRSPEYRERREREEQARRTRLYGRPGEYVQRLNAQHATRQANEAAGQGWRNRDDYVADLDE